MHAVAYWCQLWCSNCAILKTGSKSSILVFSVQYSIHFCFEEFNFLLKFTVVQLKLIELDLIKLDYIYNEIYTKSKRNWMALIQKKKLIYTHDYWSVYNHIVQCSYRYINSEFNLYTMVYFDC